MSIVTESGSQEKFSFGEIKYRDDKTKLIEEIRLLNDQNKILKNRIRDSIREIKEREKDVQSWRSGIFSKFLMVAGQLVKSLRNLCSAHILLGIMNDGPIRGLNFYCIPTNNRWNQRKKILIADWSINPDIFSHLFVRENHFFGLIKKKRK